MISSFLIPAKFSNRKKNPDRRAGNWRPASPAGTRGRGPSPGARPWLCPPLAHRRRNCTQETNLSCNRMPPGLEGSAHETPHQIEPFHSAEEDAPRLPAIPPERTKDQQCSTRGFCDFGGRGRRREAGAGVARKNNGTLRAAASAFSELSTRPHTSVGGLMSRADMAHGHTAHGTTMVVYRKHDLC